jgi:DNA (cytosine-5)-methyltransferase 1
MPTVWSLFSGVGGFDLALERTGFTVTQQVENDPFCRRVLAARWPGVERRGDVRVVAQSGERMERDSDVARHGDAARSGWQTGGVDLLVGGFPCQDLSIAGKRAGLGGARSSLFHEFVRIAKIVTPTWGLVENVPGLLSSHRGRDFWAVLQGLRQCWPAVGWRVLDSQYFGVPQRRRRVFLVGGPTAARVAHVLALTEGSSGNPAPGGEAGADVAYALAASVRGTGDGHGNAWNSTYVTSEVEADVARGLAPGPHGARYDGETETFVMATLNSGDHDGGFRTEPGEHLVFDPRQITSDKNYSHPQSGDPCHPLAAGMHAPAVAFRRTHSIRRLTPLECERLQGFPDGWTCLCQPLAAYAENPDVAALRCRCPDGPRYSVMGNAVTVPVIEWLGRRLGFVLRDVAASQVW